MVEASSLGELRVIGDPADPNTGQGQMLGPLLDGGGERVRGSPVQRCRGGFPGREEGVSDQPWLSHWPVVRVWASYHHCHPPPSGSQSQCLQSWDGNLMRQVSPGFAVLCRVMMDLTALDSPDQPGVSP